MLLAFAGHIIAFEDATFCIEKQEE